MHPSRVGRTEFETFVKPNQALGRTALISGALSLLPVFAALLWLTFASPPWPIVVAAELVVTVAFFTVYLRFRLVFSAVSRTHFVKQRMLLTRITVDRSRIDRVIMRRVYRAGTSDALMQLLAVDAEGGRLFAMSELFWSTRSIQAVNDALGVPMSIDRVPMSRREYYAQFPTARTWYARRVVGIASLAAVAAALTVIVIVLQAFSMAS